MVIKLHFIQYTYLSVHSEQYVVTLDISVNDFLSVEESKSLQTVSTDARYLSLCEDRLRDNVCEGATVQVLHDDPQLVTH